VELVYGADSVALRVVDNGHGFDLGDVTARPTLHWGLASMEERARTIGAEFRVFSRPGIGTEVEASAKV
jgi:signal transduction histidine kinase